MLVKYSKESEQTYFILAIFYSRGKGNLQVYLFFPSLITSKKNFFIE